MLRRLTRVWHRHPWLDWVLWWLCVLSTLTLAVLWMAMAEAVTFRLVWHPVPHAERYHLTCAMPPTAPPITITTPLPMVEAVAPAQGRACCTVTALTGAVVSPPSAPMCVTWGSVEGQCIFFQWKAEAGQKIGFCQ